MDSPARADTEPFPALNQTPSSGLAQTASVGSRSAATNRQAASSSFSNRLRRASETFEQSNLPEGFFAAASGIASSILSHPTVPQPVVSTDSPATQQPDDGHAPLQPTVSKPASNAGAPEISTDGASVPRDEKLTEEPPGAAPFPNGYHFPPKHSFAESTKLGCMAFWNYFLTPVGFVVTIYGLNVVAWGGMLFLLLCNAAPAMCTPTCNDINSPRRIWIEIDSQILNALFCVTGFGLAPWRFRDLYFLMQYRLFKKPIALRRLAGIHRGWFRLEGSTYLPAELGPMNISDEACQEYPRSAIPFPDRKIPNPPLTGVRARMTRVWKLDLVIWLMVWNTFFQCCLAGFMWGMNRYDRPSWSTGLFVALACIVAAAGGLVMFIEAKAVKGIEGVPVSQKDADKLQRDRERGVWHFNNIKDQDSAAKKSKK
ncbi:hypothetical protein DCS_06550 [Drechmeria coniospora]|uniref:Alpha-L-rhamnosidase C n=1 Tax=Drechmeria coniospora TaxID=98403 RepID=A0A151GBW1_DRECN|nr:hypothetical protein DCS_06550 [Drechmeria coniospora]KYK54590.1 hypothetical protein DCS_06550 [Drechmeria coniospora]ODA80484.1 hypothetical protein RJ55_03442 [Drechmeria coniospora]